MNSIKRIAVIGGDYRQIQMIYELAKKGYEVYVYGIDAEIKGESIFKCEGIHLCVDFAHAVILPLPMSRDGKTLNAPLSKNKIYIADMISLLRGTGKPALAGAPDEETLIAFRDKGITIIDYYEDEELQLQNAALTAEGAVSIAVRDTEISLLGAKCLITGYGRIAKFLEGILPKFGAEVTVAARNPNDRTNANLNGSKAIEISSIKDFAGSFQIVFNTVPAPILDEETVSRFNKGCCIIELASLPGAVDSKICQKYNIKYIEARGLPGKFSPKSAGIIICNTAIRIISALSQS